jgi:hypothetical protein
VNLEGNLGDDALGPFRSDGCLDSQDIVITQPHVGNRHLSTRDLGSRVRVWGLRVHFVASRPRVGNRDLSRAM